MSAPIRYVYRFEINNYVGPMIFVHASHLSYSLHAQADLLMNLSVIPRQMKINSDNHNVQFRLSVGHVEIYEIFSFYCTILTYRPNAL